MSLEPHEFAEIFPMMSQREIGTLAKDIKKHGQHDAIVLYEGKILDGRHRYAACIEAGVAPITGQFTGEDALAFVISHNLHRRHLDTSQRAMVAAKLAKLKLGSNQHREGRSNDLPSRKEAAEALNVGEAIVGRAKRVQRDGTQELQEAVTKSEMTVNEALSISKLPPEEQNTVVRERKEKKKREREPKPEREGQPKKRIQTVHPSKGRAHWINAKTYLEKILPTDTERVEALTAAAGYIKQRLENDT